MKRRLPLGPVSGPPTAGRHELSVWGAGEKVNRAVGFTSIMLCVVSGMILGLWSFVGPISVPESIGAYDDLPRRLLRLGHISFFGLGMINLALAGHAGRLAFDQESRDRALTLMNIGNLGLPPLLIIAAWQPALVYAMPIPVFCIFLSMALATKAAWRGCSS